MDSVSLAISIHAPLAGCDHSAASCHARITISIHAPLAGCDDGWNILDDNILISIHAPLAGCDQNVGTILAIDPGFQSTHPLRGATGSVQI